MFVEKKTPYPVTPYPQKHQINQILKPAFIPLPLCMTDMLFTTRLCFQTPLCPNFAVDVVFFSPVWKPPPIFQSILGQTVFFVFGTFCVVAEDLC